MKTRAILQTSPFINRDGKLIAFVRFKPDGAPAPITATIEVREEHADLNLNDTITVERHGSEWRAV